MILVVLALAACKHPAPAPAPTAAPAPAAVAPAPTSARPPPTLSSVHFTQGSSKIADADLQYMSAAKALLLGDPNLSVVLVGHADNSGDPESNRALSEARAAFVKNELVAAGVDGSRITIAARGEADARGDGLEYRRVDFTFARAGGSAALAATPAPTSSAAPAPATAAAAAPAEKSAAKEKGGKAKGAAEPVERVPMKPIGIADLDSFFARVQTIRDRVWSIQDSLVSARTNLTSALGVASDLSVDMALANLIETAKGSIQLTMVGTKPKLSVVNAPSPQVAQAVDAVNGMLDAAMQIATEIPKFQQDATALVAEAQAIPAKAPTMLKDAGTSPTQIPKMLGAIKTDVQLTVGLPGELKALMDEGVSTINLVKSSFAK